MDGVILAESMAPAGAETGFTERIYRLPCCPFSYRPPDYAPQIPPPPSIRNGFITFGSFNNPAKVGPEVVSVWAGILRCIPNSRLILKARSLADPTIANLMRHRFEIFGVDSARLNFRGPSSHAEMLAQYGDIDIALDPFPFCGGLTTCEALWMGVPVVTLPRLRPMSRQGASLLRSVGLDSLVAATPREYLAIAVKLANDVGRIQLLRSSMRELVATSTLFDGAVLARALERVYVQAHQISHRETS
jgi:protein O-GlcNAc transferase